MLLHPAGDTMVLAATGALPTTPPPQLSQQPRPLGADRACRGTVLHVVHRTGLRTARQVPRTSAVCPTCRPWSSDAPITRPETRSSHCHIGCQDVRSYCCARDSRVRREQTNYGFGHRLGTERTFGRHSSRVKKKETHTSSVRTVVSVFGPKAEMVHRLVVKSHLCWVKTRRDRGLAIS